MSDKTKSPYEHAEELDVSRLCSGCLSISKSTGFTLLVLEVKKRLPGIAWTVCYVPIDGEIRDITFRDANHSWIVYPE